MIMLNELLENSSVFACLEASDRDRVIRSANPQIYKKGQLRRALSRPSKNHRKAGA
jgi:hypothetical protein